MTFDLSALTSADTAVSVKLRLFNTGGESNTAPALPQVYTLFQVPTNWAGTPVPGPEGTALASINITPSVGTDTQDIEFSSPELVNAFNNAIGGILYLGIKSDKEGTAARSFTFLNSTEDAGREPSLISSTTIPPVVTVSVADASMAEPGPDTATFTLTRSPVTSNAVTVFYTFSGTATKDLDFTDAGSGSVTFAPGAATADVVLSVINDAVAERLETVVFTLTPNANYDAANPSTGTATIVDDNDDNNNVLLRYIFTDANSTVSSPSPAAQVYSTEVSATDLTAAAGLFIANSGIAVSAPNAGFFNSENTAATQGEAITNKDYFSFTVTPIFGKSLTLTELELSAIYRILGSGGGLQGTIFVRSSLDNYASDVAFRSFDTSLDYTEMSIPLGSSFAQIPGEVTFRVYIFDDTYVPQDGFRIDDMFVRGSIGELPAGLQQVKIEATDANAAEPSDPGVFTITRAGETSASATIQYGIGGTAVNGTDYTLITDEVTLSAGVTSATVTIMPVDTLTFENDQTVTLTLIEPSGFKIYGPATATVTIVDDEPDPFQTWGQANGLTAGENDGFAENPDQDAFANGLEWILGGTTPLGFDKIGIGTTGELLNVVTDGSQNLVFTFLRIDESEGLVSVKVEFSNDLFVTDNHEVTIGESGSQGTPPDGVTVQIVENADAPDAITVTIPASYAGPNNRLFGRLRATRP